jgi:hypothetical protein
VPVRDSLAVIEPQANKLMVNECYNANLTQVHGKVKSKGFTYYDTAVLYYLSPIAPLKVMRIGTIPYLAQSGRPWSRSRQG